MLVYTIWDTPARAAASMALRALSNRSPTVVVETSSIASAPANASSRVLGSAKSARRTVTPFCARSVSLSTSRPVATICAGGVPAARS